MERLEFVEAMKTELAEIGTQASVFFQKAVEQDTEVASGVWGRTEREFYWSILPPDLQSEGVALEHKVLALVGDVAKRARSSALVTEPDQRDLSVLAKTMRAAFRLRDYSHQDPEVLVGESDYVGIQPESQREDYGLAPGPASKRVSESLDRLESIIDLIAVSALSPSRSESFGAVSRVRQNTAFIMMWIDSSQPHLDDVNDTVRRVFADFAINALRADDIEHEGKITERILSEIRTSEFLLADLTGERPSVYYEVGYAHALGRRVMLYREKGTKLHFDLADYNCPDYANLRDLEAKLSKRLEQATNRKPRTGQGADTKRQD
jgi:hypothetical protein